MTIRFYLPRYKSKNPEQTIFCRIYEKRKELNLNTGEKIEPKYWDKERQRASIRKAKNPQLKSDLSDINEFLDIYFNKVRRIVRQYRKENISASFEEISNAVKFGFIKREITFFTIYREFLLYKEKQNDIKFRTIQKYQRLERLLKDFEVKIGKEITFNMIDEEFLNNLFHYMISELKFINATAYKNISHLKTFLHWCHNKKRNYLTNDDFTEFKEDRNKGKDNEVIFLTNDELMKLYNLEIESNKLKRVRDIFCFQCFTGQRYSDIERISREDIKNGEWKFRSKKTEDNIKVPLSGYAITILAKYSDWEKPLPIITNQKMNMYLKELCKIAGIDSEVKISRKRGNNWNETIYKKYQVVGTHTARRTFITLSLMKGMKPKVIMEITGHTTHKMMDRYTKIAEEFMRDEMDKTWGSPLTLNSSLG